MSDAAPFRRGEIRWARMPTDPPGKGPRPVLIVSPEARNRHPRAHTILVVPFTSSIHRLSPWHVVLSAGETGLPEDSALTVENITAILKGEVLPAGQPPRVLSHAKICALAELVRAAMGCI